MPRPLSESVVVVTGASSGIGRATAVMLAGRGASVVLAARREALLEQVARECEAAGGRALAVPTDVTDEDAMRDLAARAVDAFGRIDVWVNNAGVTMFAPFEEAPSEPYRRVIETNLFGYIHGARAALPHFRKQGSGILINNASQDARITEPHVSAYAISKHGILALSKTLRMETAGTDIEVCTLLPAAIDTPLFQHAANYTGRAIRPPPPVYPVEEAAEAMVDLMENPERERFVGNAGRVTTAVNAVAPNLFERLGAKPLAKAHFQRRKRAEPTDGNLFEPMEEGTDASGGWRGRGRNLMRKVALTAGVTAVAATAFGVRALTRDEEPEEPGSQP